MSGRPPEIETSDAEFAASGRPTEARPAAAAPSTRRKDTYPRIASEQEVLQQIPLPRTSSRDRRGSSTPSEQSAASARLSSGPQVAKKMTAYARKAATTAAATTAAAAAAGSTRLTRTKSKQSGVPVDDPDAGTGTPFVPSGIHGRKVRSDKGVPKK